MKRLQCNGYIIQKESASRYEYKGIEGDNWYLNYCSNNAYFENFYNENIDKSWENSDYVDCCIDESYMRQYIAESMNIGIKFRIMLCSTCKKFPVLNDIKLDKSGEFLGYDYAESGGSYYSCVLNDIISKRIKEFEKIKLNENGLFNTYEEVEEFVKYRKKLEEKGNYDFEGGDFIIYKIIEISI